MMNIGMSGGDGDDIPAVIQPLSAAEQGVISAARAGCLCGHAHEDGTGITPVTAARMRAYLQAHPGRQFAYDEGIVALIIADPVGGAPEVLAWSYHLSELLDLIGAPLAVNPS